MDNTQRHRLFAVEAYEGIRRGWVSVALWETLRDAEEDQAYYLSHGKLVRIVVDYHE